MTAQTYSQIKQTVAIALTQAQSPYTVFPDNFTAQFEEALSYAQNRIYRDIPMLAARVVDTSTSTINGSRIVSIAAISPPLLVVEQMGLTLPAAGGIVQYQQVSLDFLNRCWPQVSVTVAPSLSSNYGQFWALQSDGVIVIAPTPNAAYVVSLTGLTQPATLSSTNTTSYLGNNYPELLIAACLVALTGILTRNFGAQADEPQSAMSWERQYEMLLAAARDEEARRRGLVPNMPMPQPPATARPAQ